VIYIPAAWYDTNIDPATHICTNSCSWRHTHAVTANCSCDWHPHPRKTPGILKFVERNPSILEGDLAEGGGPPEGSSA